jgi:hypothetical protein
MAAQELGYYVLGFMKSLVIFPSYSEDGNSNIITIRNFAAIWKKVYSVLCHTTEAEKLLTC